MVKKLHTCTCLRGLAPRDRNGVWPQPRPSGSESPQAGRSLALPSYTHKHSLSCLLIQAAHFSHNHLLNLLFHFSFHYLGWGKKGSFSMSAVPIIYQYIYVIVVSCLIYIVAQSSIFADSTISCLLKRFKEEISHSKKT